MRAVAGRGERQRRGGTWRGPAVRMRRGPAAVRKGEVHRVGPGGRVPGMRTVRANLAGKEPLCRHSPHMVSTDAYTGCPPVLPSRLRSLNGLTKHHGGEPSGAHGAPAGV